MCVFCGLCLGVHLVCVCVCMCVRACVHLVDNVFMSTNAALCFYESGEILCW